MMYGASRLLLLLLLAGWSLFTAHLHRCVMSLSAQLVQCAMLPANQLKLHNAHFCLPASLKNSIHIIITPSSSMAVKRYAQLPHTDDSSTGAYMCK